MFTSAFAMTAGSATSNDGLQIASNPAPLGDFTLTNQDGHEFSFSTLRGRDVLVFFGFTHCPSVCPAALFKLKLLTETLREAGEAAPVVVLVSVDGARDTPAALKTYLSGYSKEFVGLTGDPRLVRNIAAEFKAVFFKGLPGDDSGNYLVEHTSQVYLVDGQGRLRATFYDSPIEAMARTTRAMHDGPS